MNKILRYGLQSFNYTIFMAVVWYFSTNPPYHQLENNQAVITLSFTHATKLREACRKLTQQEIMKLAPNMRLATDCPRERSPMQLELYLDDKLLAKATVEPTGFHKDQGVNIFQRIKVVAGKHALRLWMNDNVNIDGPTYRYEKIILIKPEQQLLIDFDAGSGGFFTN
jgi:hypothetical protein